MRATNHKRFVADLKAGRQDHAEQKSDAAVKAGQLADADATRIGPPNDSSNTEIRTLPIDSIDSSKI